MMKRDLIIRAALAATLACAATVLAQAPVVNIGPKHPNLRAAEENIVQAYQKVDQAQRSNEDQLGGHADKAKELLLQADKELRLAANASNADSR